LLRRDLRKASGEPSENNIELKYMTNKEKSDEISEHYATSRYLPNDEEIAAYNAALEMAEWKDEQFNEEKKDLLELVNMLECNEKNQTIIEDLKEMLSL